MIARPAVHVYVPSYWRMPGHKLSPTWCSYRWLFGVVPGYVQNPLGDDEADTVEEIGGWQEGKHGEQRRYAQHSLLVDILKRVSS